MNTLKLFYSYAHEDEKLHDALAKHITLLQKQGIIQPWYDRLINAGEEWEEKIEENLETADIIVLLISVDFISSNYCWGKEMTRALERHNAGEARVIPVIVRPVDWSGAPFAKLQALPKDGKPVSVWSNKETAWVDVAKGIKKAAEELIAGLPVERSDDPKPKLPQISKTPQKTSIAFNQRPGSKLHRIIYNAQNTENLANKIVLQEGDPPSGDIAVNEAFEWSGATYNFFWNIYKRNSLDNKGLPLKATVHYSKNYNNAFWNGNQVILGDGDGDIFNRFTISIDVLAKELSKGILQFEVNFQYWEQSGALVESISSVFASLVKQYTNKQTADEADWLIGAGLLTNKVKGKGLHSLSNPGTAYNNDPILGTDPQPSNMNGYVNTSSGNGGVYINSGIPNRAFYLIATAIGGYAWEKAGNIWYEAICDKRLKANAQFKDFAYLTYLTAKRLYGIKSDESIAVHRGWQLVGIHINEPKKSKVNQSKSTISKAKTGKVKR